MSPELLARVMAFILGACLASFVNLVAWRVPLRISIVRPPSTCPQCGRRIPLYALLPIVGYALSRGTCAHCKVPVSLRYPLVEFIGGLLAVALWLGFAKTGWLRWEGARIISDLYVPFVLHLTFVMALLSLLLMDLDWLLLPDKVTLPLALLGFLAALAAPSLGLSLSQAAYGALLGGGLLFVVGFVFALLTGKAGLGGGDWKLGLALGAWLGPQAIPFIWLASAVLGLLAVALFRSAFTLKRLPLLEGEILSPEEEAALAAHSGGAYVPYGPFMILAALVWLFFKSDLLSAWRMWLA